MDLSRRWLLDYVDVADIDDKTFADEMTLSGSKVECYGKEGEELKNIVVGKILSLEKHPDSDHMWICMVDVGADAPLQIVTGAQNLSVGDYVPTALDNSVVHGGKEIKSGKLRGVESCGMLCSLGELGLTKHDFPYAIEDGIFVLGDDCDKTPGKCIKEAIGLNDTVTEFEITPNRPDCLSVVGLAREAAVTFGRKLSEPKTTYKTVGGDVKELLHSVTIEAADKCFRYAGAVVKNVRVKPSPKWIRERLRACGVRPINNIVDITNFVMLEYGQPMHAFDLRYLDGGKVIVRNAKDGESITTLDGVERKLSPEMLVIADENKPVAVAGVMGGEYSGIMDDTNTIVFESACFYGPSIRKTAKKLGMRTEASGRFEKGLDPDGCLKCLDRALSLVEELDAGDIVEGVVDMYPNPKKQTVLDFCPDWVNNFIGINVSADEQKKILTSLEFEIKDGKIYVPSFRSDVEHKADISEEIARFYGFDKIAVRELQGEADGGLNDFQKFEKLIVNKCIALGLSEIVTYSFISPKAYDKINLAADSPLRKCVVISNPLGEDTGVMRTSMIPSMMETLSRNYNNRNLSACLFENGKVYIPKGADELPDENRTISVGMYGNGVDFFELKGKIEALFDCAGIAEYDVEPVTDDPTFHPGRTAEFTVNGERIAILGEIHPDVAENYSIDTKVYAASVSLDKLFKLSNTKKTYKPSPRFPALTRDLAVVCDRITPVLKLEKVIAKAVGETLEHISLFDVYQGEQIEKGKKSVAFSLRLRAANRTMTDDEADAAMKKAIEALENIGAGLRK